MRQPIPDDQDASTEGTLSLKLLPLFMR
jgi:hypothetical protein